MKKKVLILTALAVIVAIGAGGFLVMRSRLGAVGGAASTPSASKGVFRTLSPGDAYALIKGRPDLLILDVRGPEELRSGFIEGSQLMPITEIFAGRQVPPKGRPILLVCAVGGRSLGLGQMMASYEGWPEIYNLEGGISNWKAQGLPLITPAAR